MQHRQPHQSFFTYTLARPYPYRWFTPAVILGGIVATILFSLLNLAANGYILANEVSTNPNQTLSHGTWYQDWPKVLIGNSRPSCQPVLLSNEGTIFTNQTALTYTIDSIYNEYTDSVSPSLEYHNNILTDCSVTSIDISLEWVTVRTAKQLGYEEWGPVSRAYIVCTLYGARGKARLNLTTIYDYVLDRTSLASVGKYLGTGFIQRNVTTRPSLWWGESLMSLHWRSVALTMADLQRTSKAAPKVLLKAALSFTPIDPTRDITSLDFFNLNGRFISEDQNLTFFLSWTGSDPRTVSDLADSNSYPFIWIQADNLAKSFYSTILTDLGRMDMSDGPDQYSNILKDPSLVRSFSSNASNILDLPYKNSVPGPATREEYANGTYIDTISTVGMTPSVISASYLCQVPKLKSTGNLIVSILIADLVFLQALWTLFKFIVDTFVLKHKHHYYDNSDLDADPQDESNVQLRKYHSQPYRALMNEETDHVEVQPIRKVVLSVASGSTLLGPSTSEPATTDQQNELAPLSPPRLKLQTSSEAEEGKLHARHSFHRRMSSSVGFSQGTTG